MAHYEFSGTLGECLSRLDDYLGLKDLNAKARIVVDIDRKDERHDDTRNVQSAPRL